MEGLRDSIVNFMMQSTTGARIVYSVDSAFIRVNRKYSDVKFEATLIPHRLDTLKASIVGLAGIIYDRLPFKSNKD